MVEKKLIMANPNQTAARANQIRHTVSDPENPMINTNSLHTHKGKTATAMRITKTRNISDMLGTMTITHLWKIF